MQEAARRAPPQDLAEQQSIHALGGAADMEAARMLENSLAFFQGVIDHF
jgi:hypothetical protein